MSNNVVFNLRLTPKHCGYYYGLTCSKEVHDALIDYLCYCSVMSSNSRSLVEVEFTNVDTNYSHKFVLLDKRWIGLCSILEMKGVVKTNE